MLQVENIEIVGFKPAIRGMRNPYDSWAKSDSIFPIMPHYNNEEEYKAFCKQFSVDALYDSQTEKNGFLTYEYSVKDKDGIEHTYQHYYNPVLNTMYFASKDHEGVSEAHLIEVDRVPLIGQADLELEKKLINAGSVHSKFERYLVVYMDVTGSFDFWKEYDTYKVGTVANSCSTMHTITKHPLTIDNFSTADLTADDIEYIKRNLPYLNKIIDDDSISTLEKTRRLSKLNFVGFQQKRTLMLNYGVIHNILKWRSNHKLEEWRYFCNQILANLPYIQAMYIDK